MAKKEIAKSSDIEMLYGKEQIVASIKYSKRADLLRAILQDNVKYSENEVEKEIDRFMKGKVN